MLYVRSAGLVWQMSLRGTHDGQLLFVRGLGFLARGLRTGFGSYLLHAQVSSRPWLCCLFSFPVLLLLARNAKTRRCSDYECTSHDALPVTYPGYDNLYEIGWHGRLRSFSCTFQYRPQSPGNIQEGEIKDGE